MLEIVQESKLPDVIFLDQILQNHENLRYFDIKIDNFKNNFSLLYLQIINRSTVSG